VAPGICSWLWKWSFQRKKAFCSLEWCLSPLVPGARGGWRQHTVSERDGRVKRGTARAAGFHFPFASTYKARGQGRVVAVARLGLGSLCPGAAAVAQLPRLLPPGEPRSPRAVRRSPARTLPWREEHARVPRQPRRPSCWARCPWGSRRAEPLASLPARGCPSAPGLLSQPAAPAASHCVAGCFPPPGRVTRGSEDAVTLRLHWVQVGRAWQHPLLF